MTDRRRFEELASRYLDARLTPEEEAELEKLLREGTLGQEFLELTRLSREIGSLLAAPIPDEKMVALVEEDLSLSARRSPWARKATLAAAALLLGVGVAMWAVLRPSEGAIARVASAEGAVYVLTEKGRVAAAEGSPVFEGHGLLTAGERSRAVVAYPDGTRVELTGDSSVERFSAKGSKRVVLTHGVLSADVTPQPAGRPMVLSTRAAEVTVLGTKLTVLSDPESSRPAVNKGGVPLEREANGRALIHVDRGAVQVTRKTDAQSVQVQEGNFTMAAGSVALASRPLSAPPSAMKATLLGHTGPVWYSVFSPDGKALASTSVDRSLKLWSPDGRRDAVTLGKRTEDLYMHLAFSPDGRMLAVGTGHDTNAVPGEVELWDVATGRPAGVLSNGHTSSIYAVAFSPDGRTLATGAGRYDNSLPGEAILWDVASGRERAFLPVTASVLTLAYSPDGATLAMGNADGTIFLWDTASEELRCRLDGHSKQVWSVAFSRDGRTLASASGDRTAKLWDVAAGRLRTTLEGHAKEVWSLAFSPDGALLVTGSGDKTVRVWDVAAGALRTTLSGHEGIVWGVGFSPDGETAASAADDWTVRLWRAR